MLLSGGATTAPGVFAVGDCAGVDDVGSGAYRADWMESLLAHGDGATLVCQCEEVTRAGLIGVQPPGYLGPPPPAQLRRDLAGLLADGPPNQDQVKRLTRAGMGVCQGRRCREQIALILQRASGEAPPLAGYRAPVRPLPLRVLAAADEAAPMSENWDVWFGIPSQWTPDHHLPAPTIAAPAVHPEPFAPGASVVIIGAGVTGLSAAWWLARSGVSVLVLDKGVVGWEASGRNGGGASHYHSPLFHEEQRLWPLMDELLGYQTEYRRERIIFATTPAHLADYHHMAAMGRELGYRVDDLDPHQVREAVPLAGENVLGGIHLRYGGHANPQRTVQAYAWALRDLGGRILQHARVTGIEVAGGRAVSVETTRGVFGCDALVVAAGPQTGQLLETIGVRLPLAPARAEMIVTEPAPLMVIGGVDGNGLYGRQTLRGNLAYGGGPHEWTEVEPDGPKARPSTPLARNLARRVAELLPKAAHLRVIRSWAGVVENTPDGRPVIDRLADPGNVTVATLSGVGFGLSPASGHAIRDLVVEGACSFADLSKLRLDRFADTPADWRFRRGWD
jgi:sarcosine oxidase subunit beta